MVELSNKVVLLQAEKDEQTLAVCRLHDEANVLQQDLETSLAQLQLFSENIEQKIDSLKSDYIELLNSQANAKNELRYIDTQLQQQESRNGKLDETNEKFIGLRQDIAERKHSVLLLLDEAKEKLEKQVQNFYQEQRKLESIKIIIQSKKNLISGLPIFAAIQITERNAGRDGGRFLWILPRC